MSPPRRDGRGRVWGVQRAGTVTMGCRLSSSDTQYKMTISMAVWPSEASEVSQGGGQAPGHPASDGRQMWPAVCRLLGTSPPLPPRLLPPVSPKDCAGDTAVNGTDRPLRRSGEDLGGGNSKCKGLRWERTEAGRPGLWGRAWRPSAFPFLPVCTHSPRGCGLPPTGSRAHAWEGMLQAPLFSAAVLGSRTGFSTSCLRSGTKAAISP